MSAPTRLGWLALLLAGCASPAPAPVADPAADAAVVPAAAPEPGPVPAAPAGGYVAVVAAHSAVVAPAAAARIERVFVRMGESVAAGAPVAQLDVRALAEEQAAAVAALAAARAASDKSRVAVARAREQLRIDRSLYRDGISSGSKVKEGRLVVRDASAGAAQAAAEVERARSEMARLERLIADGTLRAPIAGIVSLQRVREGDRVAAGEALLSILAPGELTLRFAVPAGEAASVATGQRVLFMPGDAAAAAASGAALGAIIREVAPELEPPLQLVVAEAEFDAPEAALARLRAGSLGRVRLVGEAP